MRAFLALLLVLLTLAARATDVGFPINHWTTAGLTNRTVIITPLSLSNAPGAVVSYDRMTGVTDTNGYFAISNMVSGTYQCTVLGPPDTFTFRILIPPGTNYVTADSRLVANAASTWPPGTVAWSASASDQRYLSRDDATNDILALVGQVQGVQVAPGTWQIASTNAGAVTMNVDTGAVMTAVSAQVSQSSNALAAAITASTNATGALLAGATNAVAAALQGTVNSSSNSVLSQSAGFANTASNAVAAQLVGATNASAALLSGATNALAGGLQGTINSASNSVVSQAAGFANTASNAVTAQLTGATNALAGGLQGTINSASNSVVSQAAGFANTASNAVTAQLTGATNALAGALQSTINSASNSVVSQAAGFANTASNAIIAQLNGATNALAGDYTSRIGASSNALAAQFAAYTNAGTAILATNAIYAQNATNAVYAGTATNWLGVANSNSYVGSFSGNGSQLTNTLAGSFRQGNWSTPIDLLDPSSVQWYPGIDGLSIKFRTNGSIVAPNFQGTNIAGINVMASNLTLVSNPTFTLSTNIVALYGSGNGTNDGSYVWSGTYYTNSTGKITFQTPTWFIQSPTGGTNWYSASVPTGPWSVVSGIAPAPTSSWGVIFNLNGIQFTGAIASASLDSRFLAQSNGLQTQINGAITNGFLPAATLNGPLTVNGFITNNSDFYVRGTLFVQDTNGDLTLRNWFIDSLGNAYFANLQNLTNLSASSLASGTVPLARLSGITSAQLASSLWQSITNPAAYATNSGYATNAGTAATATSAIWSGVATNAMSSIYASNATAANVINSTNPNPVSAYPVITVRDQLLNPVALLTWDALSASAYSSVRLVLTNGGNVNVFGGSLIGNADSATAAGYATNAGAASTAGQATHATNADNSIFSAQTAHATNADNATVAYSATYATNVANAASVQASAFLAGTNVFVSTSTNLLFVSGAGPGANANGQYYWNPSLAAYTNSFSSVIMDWQSTFWGIHYIGAGTNYYSATSLIGPWQMATVGNPAIVPPPTVTAGFLISFTNSLIAALPGTTTAVTNVYGSNLVASTVAAAMQFTNNANVFAGDGSRLTSIPTNIIDSELAAKVARMTNIVSGALLTVDSQTNLTSASTTNLVSLAHSIAASDATGTNCFVSCTNINGYGTVIYWDFATGTNVAVYPTNIFIGAQFSLGIKFTNAAQLWLPTNINRFATTNGLSLSNTFWVVAVPSNGFARVSWMTNSYNQEAAWNVYQP